jgi:hypothetical protein
MRRLTPSTNGLVEIDSRRDELVVGVVEVPMRDPSSSFAKDRQRRDHGDAAPFERRGW